MIANKNGTPTNKNHSLEETGSELREKIWLDAWYDPLANITASSSCMTFCDVNGDGDHKFVVASSSANPLINGGSTGLPINKMRVYKGTQVVNESVILEEPVAVCSYYSDLKMPRKSIIAVGCGSFVFLYRNLQPFFKFTIPPIVIDPDELAIWAKLGSGKYDEKTGYDELFKLRDLNKQLSIRSYELLSLTEREEIKNLINQRKNTPLNTQNILTCMTVLKKDKDEVDAIGCLVLGTESKAVMILDPSGSSVLKKFQLQNVPVFMVTHGAYDNDYRVIIACRNGSIYTLKGDDISGVVIELDSQPCGMLRIEKSIVVGTMNCVLHYYHTRGKKQYSVYLPSNIKNMELLDMKAQRNVKCVIAFLENNELRIYNGKTLIHTIATVDQVVGMCFGIYGTEPNVLALSYRNGGVEFKMVSRVAKLENTGKGGPPPEQEIPLKLPTRTKIYMEQTEREKEHATDMHRVFQKELCKLRLTTARAYVKILTDGQGPVSQSNHMTGGSIRLNATVSGLGPLFKIRMTITNTGQKAITRIPVVFIYNQQIYLMKQSIIEIPALIPQVQYKMGYDVLQIDETAGSDSIRILLCTPQSAIPVITAVVNMPLTDALVGSVPQTAMGQQR
ncbi:BBS1 [Acrasis kona]|uniref:BBS1 n=1 Tax=Acrasis kona TaxID=1008807 RepID=A0AAW2YTU9_9EUKA